MRPQLFNAKKVQHHYATLKKDGLVFEVVIKPLEAIEFKKGNLENVNDVLEFDGIFSDAKTGEKAADLKEHFKTDDESEIAKEIILEGNIQLTTEYKKMLTEQKRKEIIDIICRNGTDSRTKLPIPATRVESALDQVSINLDPFKSAKEQVNFVLEKINAFIPITFEEKKVSVLVNSKYAGKISSILSKYGKITKTQWNSDGSCSYEVSIPGGMQEEFIKKTNDFSHGEAVINLR